MTGYGPNAEPSQIHQDSAPKESVLGIILILQINYSSTLGSVMTHTFTISSSKKSPKQLHTSGSVT